jgi:ABC-type amino acid transport substrate-binding protein
MRRSLRWFNSGMRLPTAFRPLARRRFATLAAPLVLLPALLSACAPDGGSGVQSAKMATIKARGKLICGVDGSLPGFSFVGPDGRYSGLDVDVCKAMAAALFGDPEKVEYRNLNSSERFAALASGEIDLLSRNTTMTLSRDAAGGNGLNFAPPTFYDGQGVMAPTASGIRTLKDLAGKPICVESGTTTELNLADRMREQSIAYTPLKFQTGDQTYAAYLQGRCVAVTSDRSQLAGKRRRRPPSTPIRSGPTPCAGPSTPCSRRRSWGSARPPSPPSWRRPRPTPTRRTCAASSGWRVNSASNSDCPPTSCRRSFRRSATTARSSIAMSVLAPASSWIGASIASGSRAV